MGSVANIDYSRGCRTALRKERDIAICERVNERPYEAEPGTNRNKGLSDRNGLYYVV